jgi:hypothetical protein
MTARTKSTGAEKAAWMLIISSLLVIEVAAIRRDREASEGRMVNIASTVKQSLDQITGGGQFCYLWSENLGGGNATFSLMNSGALPLDRCFMVIHDNSPIKSKDDAEKAFLPLRAQEFGPVRPGANQMTTTGVILPCCSYYIQIFTRNDRFYETLTVNPDYPKNSRSTQTISIRDDKGKVIYEYPTKN